MAETQHRYTYGIWYNKGEEGYIYIRALNARHSLIHVRSPAEDKVHVGRKRPPQLWKKKKGKAYNDVKWNFDDIGNMAKVRDYQTFKHLKSDHKDYSKFKSIAVYRNYCNGGHLKCFLELSRYDNNVCKNKRSSGLKTDEALENFV
jgi:hypothetical protein